ncbi:hypothetical protein [Saccharothrix sp. NRRL B-16348]|uniref:hypothetical protein n=1 Tax=Saccharothrix sp. NRRL B-16348 TaxID=1415542 RepID=UPI0012F9E09F|nr:hypothetical protein [Saccharothrix sp. NRRL B-16348]
MVEALAIAMGFPFGFFAHDGPGPETSMFTHVSGSVVDRPAGDRDDCSRLDRNLPDWLPTRLT